MKMPSLILVLSMSACYEEVDGIRVRDVECKEMPEICEYDDIYDKCAEFDADEDPCGWLRCVYTTGPRGEWVERRRCLRVNCGIPFDEDCFAQYRVLRNDCLENRCFDEFEASACVSLDEEARNVC